MLVKPANQQLAAPENQLKKRDRVAGLPSANKEPE
jgi:hypothetical protein